MAPVPLVLAGAPFLGVMFGMLSTVVVLLTIMWLVLMCGCNSGNRKPEAEAALKDDQTPKPPSKPTPESLQAPPTPTSSAAPPPSSTSKESSVKTATEPVPTASMIADKPENFQELQLTSQKAEGSIIKPVAVISILNPNPSLKLQSTTLLSEPLKATGNNPGAVLSQQNMQKSQKSVSVANNIAQQPSVSVAVKSISVNQSISKNQSQPRSLFVQDGKSNSIATVTSQTRSLSVSPVV